MEQVNEGEEGRLTSLNVEEFEDFPQSQASRSGMTSSFVIENENRPILPDVSNARSNSFVESPIRVGANTAPSTFGSTTRGWQVTTRRNLRSQSRSPRPDRNAVRTNFDMVEVSSSTSAAADSRINAIHDDDRPEDQHVDDNDNSAHDVSVDERDAREYRSPRPHSQLNDLRRRNMIDNFTSGNVELHVSTTDVWEALVAIREARLRRERERERQFYPGAERRDWLPRSNNGVSVNLPRSSHTVVIIGDRTRVQNLQNRQNLQTMYAIPRNHKIHQNTPRLTHYIEEPNLGSGYIKELCFSADGRLICSPFGHGVRLLAFSSNCAELSNCVPPANESVQLHELATRVGHTDIVVSTKFSPKHYLLVSGCLSGKIVWYQPVV